MITGPYIASLIMSLVLLIQCLIFHDGGITALGANILNMAVIDVWIGYLTYRSVRTFLGSRIGRDKTVFIGGLLGGWAGIIIARAACGVEIGLSSLIPYGIMISLPIMAG
jgi:cobalt/nickel transport system permease protein